MREIGEQWIENGRMYKAVEGIHCSGCCNNEGDQGCYISGQGCPTYNSETDLVIKDLGPVNKDGLLACPFCKEFPKGISEGTEYKHDCKISIFYVEHSCKVIQTTEFAYSEQEAIDAWNWRT